MQEEALRMFTAGPDFICCPDELISFLSPDFVVVNWMDVLILGESQEIV